MSNKEEVKEIVGKILSCNSLSDCLTDEDRLKLSGILHSEIENYSLVKFRVGTIHKYLFGYQSNGEFVPGIDRKLETIMKDYRQIKNLLWGVLGSIIVSIILQLFT